MAEISDLRMRPHMRHCYLLLIEGCPFAFCDEPDLVDGWWTLDDRRILGGLSVPKSFKISRDDETGLIKEDSANFQLLDIEGTVPDFFGGLAKPYKLLGARLLPTEDPATDTIDYTGGFLELTAGGYLGTEAIGPEGQRGFYSCTPWASMPGQDHPFLDDPQVVYTTRETGPLLVEGRRVALYRLVFDPDTGSWPSFEDQCQALLDLPRIPPLWWGVLRQAGKVDGRIWTVSCNGPGSWYRRALANRMPTEWFPVTAGGAFELDERDVEILFTKISTSNVTLSYGYDKSTYSIPDGSKQVISDYLGIAIQAVSALNGVDGVWLDETPFQGAGGQITWNVFGAAISTTSNQGFAGRLQMTLHVKVWRVLGYDPLEKSFDGPQPFFRSTGKPGYRTAVFSTTPPGSDPMVPDGSGEWDGQGGPRAFHPLYSGTISILPSGGGQVGLEVQDNAEIYCEGQTVRPWAGGALVDGEFTDAARWWVFKGPLQLSGQDEPEDVFQVARCSWRNDSFGKIKTDDSSFTKGLHVDAFYDPRLFGLNYKPLEPFVGWASNDGAEDVDGRIQASPLSVFGCYLKRPDKAIDTIIRTLCSTGSGSWSVGDTVDGAIANHADAFFTYGQNATGLTFPATDCEIFDMSLQIPVAMIDLGSFQDCAADLQGGADGPLAMGKVAIQGGSIQSEELFGALMSSRGWAFTLKRGRIGIYAPHMGSEGKFEEGIDFEITESDLHGDAGDPGSVVPSVELRPVYPFDQLTLSFTGDPTEDWLSGQREYTSKARDIGARARQGNRNRDVQGPDLISKQWFVGDENNLKVDADYIKTWDGQFRKTWEHLIAGWVSQPHRLVEGLRISRPKGQDIYPGAILRLTNPWPANSTGGYGVTGAYARVLAVTHETDSCACIVDCLIEAAPPNALRWAPILRVVDDVATEAERHDSSERKFFVMPWGATAPPLGAFIKPPTLDAEEAPALVLGLQYDGVVWARTFSFFAESVNTIENSISYTAMGLDGTFSSRQYTVLVLAPVDHADQAAWCGLLFAQHTTLPPSASIPKLPE